MNSVTRGGNSAGYHETGDGAKTLTSTHARQVSLPQANRSNSVTVEPDTGDNRPVQRDAWGRASGRVDRAVQTSVFSPRSSRAGNNGLEAAILRLLPPAPGATFHE